MTILIESCRVSPSSGQVTELSLPLTFFDIPWLHFHPTRLLLFYETPHIMTHVLETLVPKLKQSLSLTLKHHLPLSGKLLYPLNPENNKPIFRYVAGGSVSLTISQSSSDFDHLVGYHARDANQFYDFVPQFPPLEEEPEYKSVPVFAVQVTLFPGLGLCLGLAFHHCIGDGSSIVGFIKSWASICESGGDEAFLIKQGESLPLFDRSVIKDPLGLCSTFWNVVKEIPPESSSFPLPTETVRACFVLRQNDIEKFKNLLLSKKPELDHVSSFVIATTYVWTCFVKSGEEIMDQDELFTFAIDCRGRTVPPVPDNYFGNCLSYGFARIERRKVRGDDGFVLAAIAVAESIKNKVHNKDEVLRGIENFMSNANRIKGARVMGVSGSSRFGLCIDFGWGNAKKVEVVSIDGEKYAMSLFKSCDGGLEVGLSLPKERMKSFEALFVDGLSSIPVN